MKRSTSGSFTPPTELIVSKPFAFATSAARTPRESTRLLLLEEQPDDVLRRALERGLVDVDDREARVRILVRHGRERLALREADADDEVVTVLGERLHVGDVVGVGRRLDHAVVGPELRLGALHALERELVEAAVPLASPRP